MTLITTGELSTAGARRVTALFRGRLNSKPLRYLFAVVAAVTSTALTAWLAPFIQQTVMAIFLSALILVAWYAGRGPALVTLVIALIAADLFLIPPDGWFGQSFADAIPLIVLVSVGTLIIVVSDRARTAQHRLRTAAVELEEQAVELEQQMDNAQSLQVELESANDHLEQVNQQLERSREFLEQAQRSARLGSWEWDIARDEVSWSDEMFRVFGLEPGSIAVTFGAFAERVHPDDREMASSTIYRAMETKTPFSFDHRAVLPDGRIIWVAAQGRVVTDSAGNPIRLVGSGQDITERRRISEAQRIIAESSETLASSLDYSTTLRSVARLVVKELADWCSIAVGDESGRYENIAVAHRDPARVRWAEEWAQTHPPRFDTPNGVPNVLRTGTPEILPEISPEVLRAAIQSPEELRVLEALGLYSAMTVPMIARGRTLGAITFISAESRHRFDDTDLWLAQRLAGRAAIAIDNARLFEEAKEARALAEQANRAKTDFLAAMSHEFRTPLNAIAGYSQLMELGVYGQLSDEQRGVLARLQRSQAHLLALVEEVLGFARIEAGKIKFDLADVRVSDAIANASEMLTPQMEAKQIRFATDITDDTVRVRADADRLEQILVNLLSNAVKFTDDGGGVSVLTQANSGWVTIQVVDTGVGIPSDKLETVFEPFAQLPHAASKRSSGVGLGLAISRDLARAMGGDISVVSTVGKGSTFALRLPRT